MLAVLAIVIASCALAGTAQAATFGQIGEAFGKPGFEPGQFHKPGLLGVDPVDGSIYAGDITADENNYRIQKFSSAGKLEASVLVPRKITSGGQSRVVGMRGIAVDHTRGLFYLLQSCRFNPATGFCATNVNLNRATEILAFKLAPAGGSLVLDHAIPVPTADAEAVFNPQTIAVAPSSGELILLGEDSLHTSEVVERINATGAATARYVDTAGALSPLGYPQPSAAASIAVASDGAVYAITGGVTGTGEEERVLTKGWKLPPNLSKVEELPAVAAAAAAEQWAEPVIQGRTGFIGAAQIAISPDGSTLYWKETLPREKSEAAPIVRSFSLLTGATAAIYGGGSGRCEIASTASSLATTGDRLVVFDYASEPEPAQGNPEGLNRIITFGPGGTGCGGQEVRFNVDGSATGPVQVDEGEPVELDASESVLIGEVEGLEWEFGDGSPTVVVPGPAPSLKTTHVFEKATKAGETFAVTLKVKIKGASAVAEASVEVEVAAGVPAPPRAFIEVLEPSGFFVAAGGTMRFDASQSWDPIGGTSLLKKYVWSFGDGSPDVATTAPSVVHTFANPGGSALQRLVVLTVESASGGTNSDRRLITVLAPPGSAPVPPGSADVAPPSTPPSTGTQPKPKPKPDKKPLTAKQRRQKAIAKCKKLPAGSRKRQGCLKRAARIGKETGGKKKGSGS